MHAFCARLNVSSLLSRSTHMFRMPRGTCRLCNGRHAEVNCHQYRTPAERIQRVALLDRCVLCLDFMYRCGWSCQKRCLHCDQPHHEALCTQLSAGKSRCTNSVCEPQKLVYVRGVLETPSVPKPASVVPNSDVFPQCATLRSAGTVPYCGVPYYARSL